MLVHILAILGKRLRTYHGLLYPVKCDGPSIVSAFVSAVHSYDRETKDTLPLRLP
jgi:hypothetical protein